MLLSEGMRYIRSSITASMMARSPLAPVFLSSALSAIASTASSENSSPTPSSSNSFVYCLIREFFGSFKIRISASLSSASSETVIGTRPINSGIRPNLTKSCGSACLNASPTLSSVFDFTSELKPIDDVSIRLSMIFSNPSNAPPHIKRIFVVSIGISSCCGCFLPPCGGTDATVPSSILRSACCTPSPDTSLVMDTFSDFFVILSISSIYMIPCSARSMS